MARLCIGDEFTVDAAGNLKLKISPDLRLDALNRIAWNDRAVTQAQLITSVAAGWSITGYDVHLRGNSVIEGAIQVTRTGANITSDAVGNISDSVMFTLNATFRPRTFHQWNIAWGDRGWSYGILASPSAGTVTLTHFTSGNVTLPTGGAVFLGPIYWLSASTTAR